MQLDEFTKSKCKWHLGYKHDGRSWIFIDEIKIQSVDE